MGIIENSPQIFAIPLTHYVHRVMAALMVSKSLGIQLLVPVFARYIRDVIVHC